MSLLLITAHPDDEVLCAGTLFMLKSKGHRLHQVVLTNGELGQDFIPHESRSIFHLGGGRCLHLRKVYPRIKKTEAKCLGTNSNFSGDVDFYQTLIWYPSAPSLRPPLAQRQMVSLIVALRLRLPPQWRKQDQASEQLFPRRTDSFLFPFLNGLYRILAPTL